MGLLLALTGKSSLHSQHVQRLWSRVHANQLPQASVLRKSSDNVQKPLFVHRRQNSLLESFVARRAKSARTICAMAVFATATLDLGRSACEAEGDWAALWLGLHVLSGPCWPFSLQIMQDSHMRFSCCFHVAEKSRWALPGGPSLRSQSARWLWFATATLDLGAPHANQLLREFALCSGQGPARAAQSLLALLPAELHDALEQVRLALI